MDSVRLEQGGMMKCQKSRIGVEASGRDDRLPFIGIEECSRLCAGTLQERLGKARFAHLIHSHKAAIKSAVERGRQAKAVARILPVLLVGGPWLDMAGVEQSGIGDPRNAAPDVVLGENSAPEEVLPDPLLDHRRAGAWSAKRLVAQG